MILEASGTQVAVIGTEHGLASLTQPRVYCFYVDTTNMISGDTLELRVKNKVLSGDGLTVVYFQAFSGAQSSDDITKVSVPLPADIQADFTLKQTAGTGRSFKWKVLSL